MRKNDEEVRKRMLKIRMSETELKQLRKLQEKSSEKSLSNYVRKVALDKPITVHYRNKSADEFLSEALRLIRELNAVGNNFNQAVHKLHTLDRIPEFHTWIMMYESSKQAVEKSINDIKIRLDQIHKIWSQK